MVLPLKQLLLSVKVADELAELIGEEIAKLEATMTEDKGIILYKKMHFYQFGLGNFTKSINFAPDVHDNPQILILYGVEGDEEEKGVV